MKKILFIFSFLILNLSFAANPKVRMVTSYGDIDIELYEMKAPLTVANFLKYVDDKFYDGTIFHRVIKGFMIQGGALTKNRQKKENTRAPIKNEADNGLINSKGTVAMARTNDPHSASSQFFINVEDNTPLNYTAKTESGWGYAVFGRVTHGMSVVNRIKSVRTGKMDGYSDLPMDIIEIKSVRRLGKPQMK